MTKKSKNASTKTASNQPEGPETSVFTASLPRLIPQDDPEFTRRGPRLDKDGKPQYLVDLIPDRKYTDEDESGVGTNSENESFQENALLVLHSVMFSLCLSLFFGIFTSLVNQQYGIDNDFREICISALKAIPSFIVFTFFVLKFKEYKIARLLIVSISTFFGCYFVHLNLHAPRLGVMKRAPGLITLWMFLALIMDLRPAFISIFFVSMFWVIDPFKIKL